MRALLSKLSHQLRRPRLIPILGLLATATILGYLIYSERATFVQTLTAANGWYLVLALAIFSIDLMLVIWIWSRLMRSLGVTMPFATHVGIYAKANAGKRLPGTVWYVASRITLYEREGVPPSTVANASAIEFAVSVMSSALFSALVVGDLITTRVLPQLVRVAGATALILGALASVVSLAAIFYVARRFIARRLVGNDGGRAIRLSMGAWLLYIALYSLVWLLGGCFLLAICLAFVPTLGGPDVRLVIGCWALSSFMSSLALVLPSSFGIKELSVGVLLATVMSGVQAAIIALMARLLSTAFDFAWSLAVFVLFSRSKPPVNPNG